MKLIIAIIQPSRLEAVKAALAATRDYPGVTGAISFDEHGDPIKSAVIIKIDHGRPAYLMTVSPRTAD